MISKDEILSILETYNHNDLTIASLGSHSALEILDGAKEEAFKTVCVCQKGRETPYRKFKRISDEIIIVDNFTDLNNSEVQQQLLDRNSIFVSNRSFATYVGYDNIENNFKVPIFGNRFILRAEERNMPKNQYFLLQQAGISHPKIIKNPVNIEGPCIVKVQEAKRKMERAFFFVTSYKDYISKSENRIKKGIIDEDDLSNAIIEEYAIGTYFNFNFFYSPLNDETDFLGIERRLQTNIHDFTTSLTANQQLELQIELQNIEIGHTPASIRESMLEKVFDIGNKFSNAVKRIYPPGILGPFSLQSVVTKDLDIIVYDVSLRVPGNPILATTSPYTKYQYGFTMGVGRRISMEIKNAVQLSKLDQIVT